MEKFKWCFIGTGTLAKQVAEEIIASGKHEIVSCYTRNYDNCLAFAEKTGSKPCRSAEEAMLTEGVEGVYIVTPHNAHFRYAKQALEHKIPVLCEKAFTVEGKETDELISLAKKNDTYLCEAMWTWFGNAANQVKSWVNDGEIGKVSDARFTYCMKSINYAPRVADPRRAGGALLDITIYPITYAYRLFGYPETIESFGHVENEVDHWEEVKMTFKGGEKVSMRASIVDFKGLEKMVINGTKGKIKANFYHFMDAAVCKKGLFKKIKHNGTGSGIGYLPEFNSVADDIRAGKKESDKVPLKATSDVMHILDEVRRQIGLEYTNLE